MASDPYFFGYGSLVNRRTHGYGSARPAHVRGWRRIWRHLPGREVAILTVLPAPDTEIAGLIAAVPGADWAALDEREAFYDRLPASDQVTHDLPAPAEIALYSVPPGRDATTPAPILLSYLDVVIQGYLSEFGEAGVQAFFDTTDGWNAPLLNDRAAPLYPRAQTLSRTETALVDSHLARLGKRP